jgi:hypothetical protein
VKISVGLAVLFLVVGGSAIAQETQCLGLRKLIDSRTTLAGAPMSAKISELLSGIGVLLGKRTTTSDECSSLSTVLSQLVNGRKHGGKRLEEDKPLDIGQAQLQLGEAEHDSGIHERLEQVKTETANQNIQLLLQAAILDSEGLNSARDLQIQKLQEQLK